jgi:hypothetical protein
VLATIVNRIELNPMRRPPAVVSRARWPCTVVLLRIKRRGVETRLVIEGSSAGIAWSAQKQPLGIG